MKQVNTSTSLGPAPIAAAAATTPVSTEIIPLGDANRTLVANIEPISEKAEASPASQENVDDVVKQHSSRRNSGFMSEIRSILLRKKSKLDVRTEDCTAKEGQSTTFNCLSTASIKSIPGDNFPKNQNYASDVPQMTDQDTQTPESTIMVVKTCDQASNTDGFSGDIFGKRQESETEMSPTSRAILERQLLDIQTVRTVQDRCL